MAVEKVGEYILVVYDGMEENKYIGGWESWQLRRIVWHRRNTLFLSTSATTCFAVTISSKWRITTTHWIFHILLSRNSRKSCWTLRIVNPVKWANPCLSSMPVANISLWIEYHRNTLAAEKVEKYTFVKYDLEEIHYWQAENISMWNILEHRINPLALRNLRNIYIFAE